MPQDAPPVVDQGLQLLKESLPVLQVQGEGQSALTSQRRVQALPMQYFDWQLVQGPPMSVYVKSTHTFEAEGVPDVLPLMQTLPPLVVVSQVQLSGQSLAETQAFVQMNDGLSPKQRLDWQSEPRVQPLPRSEKAQLALPPPPPEAVPPPVPPPVPLQVLGPALLPLVKPPLAVPNQQVLNPAQAEPHDCAASWQRLFTQRCELTGGPDWQLQYQYGQSVPLTHDGAVLEPPPPVPPPLASPPPVPPPLPPPDPPTPTQMPAWHSCATVQVAHCLPEAPHAVPTSPLTHSPAALQQPVQFEPSQRPEPQAINNHENASTTIRRLSFTGRAPSRQVRAGQGVAGPQEVAGVVGRA